MCDTTTNNGGNTCWYASSRRPLPAENVRGKGGGGRVDCSGGRGNHVDFRGIGRELSITCSQCRSGEYESWFEADRCGGRAEGTLLRTRGDFCIRHVSSKWGECSLEVCSVLLLLLVLCARYSSFHWVDTPLLPLPEPTISLTFRRHNVPKTLSRPRMESYHLIYLVMTGFVRAPVHNLSTFCDYHLTARRMQPMADVLVCFALSVAMTLALCRDSEVTVGCRG